MSIILNQLRKDLLCKRWSFSLLGLLVIVQAITDANPGTHPAIRMVIGPLVVLIMLGIITSVVQEDPPQHPLARWRVLPVTDSQLKLSKAILVVLMIAAMLMLQAVTWKLVSPFPSLANVLGENLIFLAAISSVILAFALLSASSAETFLIIAATLLAAYMPIFGTTSESLGGEHTYQIHDTWSPLMHSVLVVGGIWCLLALCIRRRLLAIGLALVTAVVAAIIPRPSAAPSPDIATGKLTMASTASANLLGQLHIETPEGIHAVPTSFFGAFTVDDDQEYDLFAENTSKNNLSIAILDGLGLMHSDLAPVLNFRYLPRDQGHLTGTLDIDLITHELLVDAPLRTGMHTAGDITWRVRPFSAPVQDGSSIDLLEIRFTLPKLHPDPWPIWPDGKLIIATWRPGDTVPSTREVRPHGFSPAGSFRLFQTTMLGTIRPGSRLLILHARTVGSEQRTLDLPDVAFDFSDEPPITPMPQKAAPTMTEQLDMVFYRHHGVMLYEARRKQIIEDLRAIGPACLPDLLNRLPYVGNESIYMLISEWTPDEKLPTLAAEVERCPDLIGLLFQRGYNIDNLVLQRAAQRQESIRGPLAAIFYAHPQAPHDDLVYHFLHNQGRDYDLLAKRPDFPLRETCELLWERRFLDDSLDIALIGLRYDFPGALDYTIRQMTMRGSDADSPPLAKLIDFPEGVSMTPWLLQHRNQLTYDAKHQHWYLPPPR